MSQSNVAVVLGVGPGLGAAVAHRFAREGFAVGLMARSSEQLSEIQSEIEQSGGKALSVTVDATDPASVKAAFEQVRWHGVPAFGDRNLVLLKSLSTMPEHLKWLAYWN